MTAPLLAGQKTDVPARQKWLWFLGAALVLGSVCTLVAYPGIFYSDSYGRWFLARELARFNFAVQDDWLSVVPQLFMAVLYKLTQNYASFTLVQSVLFFFSAFCAIDAFCPRGGLVAGLLFAACPVFYGFSVYVEMSVGCAVALLWLLLLLQADNAGFDVLSPGKKALYYLVCFGLYFCLLGFRQNAFTVLPVLFFWVVRWCYRIGDWLMGFLHVLAIALSLVVIMSLPSLLHFGIRNGSGSMSTGFLWETVSMLEELQDKPEYADMLDYLGEEGTTRQAVEANNYDSIYGYHDYIPNTVVGTGDNAAHIRHDYFYLMRQEPGTWWRVKTRFWGRTLGISQPLSAGEYDYNRDGRMAEFGFMDTERRQQFHQSYHDFMTAAPLVRMPWAVFLLALAALLCAKRALGRPGFQKLCMLYAAAVFFYASFLVTTQSQEFRYFFVPFLLLYMVAAGSVGALCGSAWDAFKRRRAETRSATEPNA